jgi:pimeloyl-ACP methyl ester carboxylesterase
MAQNSTGHYAPVNGLQMYYEIHGSGQPLVLIHGAFSAIGSSFGQVLPALAQSRQVIAVELQAHGHTADIDRPLSMEQMADDVAALLRYLQIEQADVFGYSIGAGVALHSALRHPQLVRKLVLASVTYSNAGFHPGLLAGIEQIQPEMMMGTPWQQEYAQIAPHPEDFPKLVEKIKYLDLHVRDLSTDEVKSIAAPMLLIIGDSDIIRPEHAVEMFRLLGGGVSGDSVGMPKSQLAILPGTSHVTLVDRAELLLPMVTAFLDKADA